MTEQQLEGGRRCPQDKRGQSGEKEGQPAGGREEERISGVF